MKETKASTSNDYELDPDKNMVSLFDTSVLVDVAAGKLDLNKIAISELQNRGLDLSGKWVGFGKNSQ
jgi:hypothetical protein